MRFLLWALALVCCMSSLPAQAGEAVDLVGRATGVYQYPKTQTICMVFETTKDPKRYFICDDVTAKDVIERLFELGKKDAECHIEGTVTKKSGEDVYLTIGKVSQGS
jgi:hypothetical protein